MSKRKNSRTGGKRFAMLPVSVLQHESVVTLNHAAFRVLVLLAAQYQGHNNGALGLTARQAAELGIGSDNTVYRAMKVLVERDLIEETYPPSRVPPRPAMYSLAWWAVDETAYSKKCRIPSHAYRNWPPKNQFLTSTECGQGPATIAVMEVTAPPMAAISAVMEAISGVPQPQPVRTSKNLAIGGGEL